MLKPTAHNYVHLDLKAHAFRPAYLRRLVEQIADSGAQGVLLEAEDKLPVMQKVGVRHHHAADGLIPLIRSAGMQVIPLIQTVGHAEYLLFCPQYASLRKAIDDSYQYCLCNPRLIPLLKRIIDLHIRAAAGSKFISLGGDEPWFGGIEPCPKCKRRIDSQSIAELYVKHLNALIRHCVKQKVSPMVWGDFLLAHPEAMRNLYRRAILKLWEYGYSQPSQWERDLACATHAGFTCWVVPAVRSSGDSMFLPSVARHLANGASAAAVARSGSAAGFLNTAWAPRLTPMSLLYAGARSIGEQGEASWPTLIGEYGQRYWGLRGQGFAQFYCRLCPVWLCFVEQGYPRRDPEGNWSPRSSAERRFETFYRTAGSAAALRTMARRADALTIVSRKRLETLEPTTTRGREEMNLWRHLLDMQRLKIRTAMLYLKLRDGSPITGREWNTTGQTVDRLRREAEGLLKDAFQPMTLRHELNVRFDEERYLLQTYA